MAYIEVQHEFKIYQMGDNQIVANRDVNFTIEQGQIAVILGPSGAGKSTVLNMLGGMDSPTKGSINIAGTDILRNLTTAS